MTARQDQSFEEPKDDVEGDVHETIRKIVKLYA